MGGGWQGWCRSCAGNSLGACLARLKSFTISASSQVRLKRGTVVKAEPDALVTMSQHIALGAGLDAGLFAGVMRSVFSGESLFSQV